MDQEKIGQIIKEIRKKNQLTQQEFAEQFGVTYQAVSKWENGKNLPDITILKEICHKYDLDINEFLIGKPSKQLKKRRKLICSITIALILLFLLCFLLIKINRNSNFEFKTISYHCDNFNIAGSIAYNQNKSSIYISHITYCGKEDETVYETIRCTLYETHGNTQTKITECNHKNNKKVTLETFLKDVNFSVNNDTKTCNFYTKNSLYLEIAANDAEGKTTTYKIHLNLKENCPDQNSTSR